MSCHHQLGSLAQDTENNFSKIFLSNWDKDLYSEKTLLYHNTFFCLKTFEKKMLIEVEDSINC